MLISVAQATGADDPPVCIGTEGAPGHRCCDSHHLFTASLPDLSQPPTQERSRCKGLPLKWFSPFLKGETQISQKQVPNSPPATAQCLWAVSDQGTSRAPGAGSSPARTSRAHGAGLLSTLFGLLSTSLVAQAVKNLPAMQETRVQSLGQEESWRREWQPTQVFLPGKSHGQRSLQGLQSVGAHRV